MAPTKSSSGLHSWLASGMGKPELAAACIKRNLPADDDDQRFDLIVRLTADDLDIPKTTKFQSRAKALWKLRLEELEDFARDSGLPVKHNIFRLVGIILVHEFPKVEKTKPPRNRRQQPVVPAYINIEDDEDEEVVRIPPPRNNRQRPAARAYVKIEDDDDDDDDDDDAVVEIPPPPRRGRTAKRKIKLPEQTLFAVITSGATFDAKVNELSKSIVREAKSSPELEQDRLEMMEYWARCKGKLGKVMGSVEGSAYIDREMADLLRGANVF
jgi:hypothetical protein